MEAAQESVAEVAPTTGEATPKEKPLEQAKLLNAEVTRQLAAVAQKRSSMHTRAAILVAASGVLTSFRTEDWNSGWQMISVVIALAAAVLGLLVMRPRRQGEANATLAFDERLEASVYSTAHSIVRDNITELKNLRARNEEMAHFVGWGYVLLVLAWMASFIISALSHADII